MAYCTGYLYSTVLYPGTGTCELRVKLDPNPCTMSSSSLLERVFTSIRSGSAPDPNGGAMVPPEAAAQVQPWLAVSEQLAAAAAALPAASKQNLMILANIGVQYARLQASLGVFFFYRIFSSSSSSSSSLLLLLVLYLVGRLLPPLFLCCPFFLSLFVFFRLLPPLLCLLLLAER